MGKMNHVMEATIMPPNDWMAMGTMMSEPLALLVSTRIVASLVATA